MFKMAKFGDKKVFAGWEEFEMWLNEAYGCIDWKYLIHTLE